VAIACVSALELEDDATLHAITGAAAIAVLAVKIAVLRRFAGAGRLLPYLGVIVFVLLAITVAASAGSYFGDS
jgi:hypothetical protein